MATYVGFCVSMHALIVNVLLDLGCFTLFTHTKVYGQFGLSERNHGLTPAAAAGLQLPATPGSLNSQRRELLRNTAFDQSDIGSRDRRIEKIHHTQCEGSNISSLENCLKPTGSNRRRLSAKAEYDKGSMDDSFSRTDISKLEQRSADMVVRNNDGETNLNRRSFLYNSHNNVLQSEGTSNIFDNQSSRVSSYQTTLERLPAFEGPSESRTEDEALGKSSIRQRKRSQMSELWEAASGARFRSKPHGTRSRPKTEGEDGKPRSEEGIFLASGSVPGLQIGKQLQQRLHKRRDEGKRQHESVTDVQQEEASGSPLKTFFQKQLEQRQASRNKQRIHQPQSQNHTTGAVIARRSTASLSLDSSSDTFKKTDTETTLNTLDILHRRTRSTASRKRTRKGKTVADKGTKKNQISDPTSRYAEFVKQEEDELGIADNTLRGVKSAAFYLTLISKGWMTYMPHLLFLSMLHYVYDMDRRLEQVALIHSRARRRLAEEILKERAKSRRTKTRSTRVTGGSNAPQENTFRKQFKTQGESLQYLTNQSPKVPQKLLLVQQPLAAELASVF